MILTMAKRALLLSALIFSLIFFFGTVSAVMITESPDKINMGDTVHLNLQGLDDGATVSIQIQGTFTVSPGQSFTFSTDNFVMPVSLSGGQLSAHTENTQTTTLLVQKGGTTASVGQTNQNGIFSYSDSRDIASGTYNTMTLFRHRTAG